MEFWGVEVKPGEVLNCDPGDDKYLHISQAALGEVQNTKGNERVPLYVHADDKKLVIGTLVFGKCDQLSLDLVFDGELRLSHSCTSGSVFFSGYYTSVSEDGVDGMEMGEDDTDSDSEDERHAQALIRRVNKNGQTEAEPIKPELKKEGAKLSKSEPVAIGKAAAKVKPEDTKPVSGQKPGEGEKPSDDDDNDDEEDSSDDDSDGLDVSEGETDDDENQKSPMVEAAGKKRPLPDSVKKTQGSADKKAKTTVPGGAQNAGKKDGPKTPVGPAALVLKDQKGQTPKAKGNPGPKETPKTPTTAGSGSGKKIGAHLCASCSRNFATESALSQHNAAKHGGKQD